MFGMFRIRQDLADMSFWICSRVCFENILATNQELDYVFGDRIKGFQAQLRHLEIVKIMKTYEMMCSLSKNGAGLEPTQSGILIRSCWQS